MPTTTPSAVILDPQGPVLTANERDFFRDLDPYGFILFKRHCQSPDQMRALTQACRETIGRKAPILIDQEGGRVARMTPQAHTDWRTHPPMQVFGELSRRDIEHARDAAWLNGYLLGQMLGRVGLDVNCTPMLDIAQEDADPVTLGDRVIAPDTEGIIAIARATIAGMSAAGVKPVIKHIPGLGRADCDSHHDLPVVRAPIEDLRAADMAPFRALADAPAAMTSHIVYTALDPENCATQSATVIDDFIRGEIGFDGFLMSDDIKMQALAGSYSDRATRSLDAGCDVLLACNLPFEDQIALAPALRPMTQTAQARAARFEAFMAPASETAAPARIKAVLGDIPAAYALLDQLIKPALV